MYESAVTAVQGVITDASGIMAAILAVVAAFWGFRKVKSLLGR